MAVCGVPPTRDRGEDWRELYRLAITETDSRVLPMRIAAAHHAIMDRIQATAGEHGHNKDETHDGQLDEQQKISDALSGLRVLQKECERLRPQNENLPKDPKPGLAEAGLVRQGW